MDRKNEILLRRKRAIIIDAGAGQHPLEHVTTALENFASLGFVFSPAVVERLQTLENRAFNDWYNETQYVLKRLVGAHAEWKPIYPNFPRQVMSASQAELWLNALMHYAGDLLGVRIVPDYKAEVRPEATDEFNRKTVIGLADETEFIALSKSLLAGRSSWSKQDREDVAFIVKYFADNLESVLPKDVSFKENLAYLATLLIRHTDRADILLTPHFRVATDVLRLAVAMHDGDISLATPTKFGSFKRRERRLLLSMLNRIESPAADMLRWRERWLRLGERLHPGEYKSRFPNAFAAFDTLRNEPREISGFNREVESLRNAELWDLLLRTLQSRPGEFARKLDLLLRNSDSGSDVLNTFSRVAPRVSTRVLLQLISHFRAREERGEQKRVFFPKGNVAKMWVTDDDRKPISAKDRDRVVEICTTTLEQRFSVLPELGRVYVAPNLRNFPVPMAQRSASAALKTVPRGTRLPIEGDGKTVRFFAWWRESQETRRVDLDLSAGYFDSEFRFRKFVSYTNLRDAALRAAHSGDITSAPNGACEYIDVDLESASAHGYRYIVMSVYSYTGQAFNALPEAFCGWMLRDEPNAGEIFDGSTVAQRVDLSTSTRTCVPAIIDTVTNDVIWCDVGLASAVKWQNNIEANERGLTHVVRGMVDHHSVNLHELFSLHARARGMLVEERDDAEFVFAVDGDVSPDNLDRIASEFM